MNDFSFYRAFEEKYRGSFECIKSRLEFYLPFVEPLKAIYSDCVGIDLGCGRGEWMELLNEHDFEMHGVDLNSNMLAECHRRGLSAENVDAVAALEALPDESKAVVSGFHIVEHISFQDLKILVQESLRVIKPGGLLILETPNPENITVGSMSFYLDPTHLRPIPPALLAFLPEFYGFSRVKVVRLNEPADPDINSSITLYSVLAGVSRDFAVIAQKAADREIIASFDRVFEKEHGVTLQELTSRFELRTQRVEGKADIAIDKASEAGTRATRAEAKANEAEAIAAQAEVRATQAEASAAQAEAKASQAKNGARQYEELIKSIYASRSWRITAPMRKVKGIWLKWKRGIFKSDTPD